MTERTAQHDFIESRDQQPEPEAPTARQSMEGFTKQAALLPRYRLYVTQDGDIGIFRRSGWGKHGPPTAKSKGSLAWQKSAVRAFYGLQIAKVETSQPCRAGMQAPLGTKRFALSTAPRTQLSGCAADVAAGISVARSGSPAQPDLFLCRLRRDARLREGPLPGDGEPLRLPEIGKQASVFKRRAL